MKNISIFLIVLFAACFLIVPVSATLINITVISNAVISVSLGTEFEGQSYVYNALPPTVIQELKVSSYGDGIPTRVSLLQSNGNTINLDITTHQISWFQRHQVINIIGGTSNTETVLSFLYPVNRIFFAQSNDTPHTYYLIATDLSYFIDEHTYAYDLDTTTDAYIVLPTRPSSNPVKSVSISSPGGRFSGTLYYVNVASLKASEDNPKSLGQTSGVTESSIWQTIADTVTKILDFFAQVASYVTTMGGLVILVFAGQIFLTLIAAYTIVAAVLSIHDSDDMFKSIGKFYKFEMTLGRFFMEIFVWMKEMIKWW